VQSSSQIVTTKKPTPSFLQAGCPSCRPTKSVKALKDKGQACNTYFNLFISSNESHGKLTHEHVHICTNGRKYKHKHMANGSDVNKTKYLRPRPR